MPATLQQMRKHIAADPHHPLAQPGHQVAARPHRGGHDHDDRQQREQRLIERRRVARAKPASTTCFSPWPMTRKQAAATTSANRAVAMCPRYG